MQNPIHSEQVALAIALGVVLGGKHRAIRSNRKGPATEFAKKGLAGLSLFQVKLVVSFLNERCITIKYNSSTAQIFTISGDGKWLFLGRYCSLAMRSTEQANAFEYDRYIGRHTDDVRCIAVSNDGKRVISGSTDKTIKVWKVAPDIYSGECERTLEGHAGRVNAVCIFPDEKYIVSGSSCDKTIKIWNINTGECKKTMNCYVQSIALSSDGKRIYAGSIDGTIKIWGAESGICLNTLKGYKNIVLAVWVSSDGKRLFSGSTDGFVRMWNTQTGKISAIYDHRSCVYSVCVSSDGKYVISGANKTIKVWDVESWACLRTLRGHADAIRSVCISRDGESIYSCSSDGAIKILKVGKCVL